MPEADLELHHGQYGEVRIDPTGVGGADGTDEVQLVTITGTPAGGTFTLTFDGETTAPIAYNASAAVVQAALLALASLRAGDVVVTGSAGGPYTLTFGGDFSEEDVATLTASAVGLTGGTSPAVAVTTPTPGVVPAIEIVESINTWSYSAKRDRVDVTCFGDRNKKKVLGLPDISGALGGFFNSTQPVIFDVADATIPFLLRLVPFKIEPDHYFQGLAYADASIKVDAKGAVSVDATWDAAGDWSRQ
jgi:hypothetical protein